MQIIIIASELLPSEHRLENQELLIVHVHKNCKTNIAMSTWSGNSVREEEQVAGHLASARLSHTKNCVAQTHHTHALLICRAQRRTHVTHVTITARSRHGARGSVLVSR